MLSLLILSAQDFITILLHLDKLVVGCKYILVGWAGHHTVHCITVYYEY